MALPSTGPISMLDVRTEISSAGVITFNDSPVRQLAGALSGEISMLMLRGKAVYTPGSATWSTPGTYLFIIPNGVRTINAAIVGGGGGGGGAVNNGGDGTVGPGGGSGQVVSLSGIAVSPGMSVTVSVGAGGAGGAYFFGHGWTNPGQAGGPSSLTIAGWGWSAGGGAPGAASHWEGWNIWAATGSQGAPGASHNPGSRCNVNTSGRWNPSAGFGSGVYSYTSGGGGGVGGAASFPYGGPGLNGHRAGAASYGYSGRFGFYYGSGGGGGGFLGSGNGPHGGLGGGGGAGGAHGPNAGNGGHGCVVIVW